jgi:hypothetical protein
MNIGETMGIEDIIHGALMLSPVIIWVISNILNMGEKPETTAYDVPFGDDKTTGFDFSVRAVIAKLAIH